MTILCVASFSVCAFAETSYQLRLFAGDPTTGTLKTNQNQQVEYGKQPDPPFNIGESNLTITNGKYYAKGIREAGKDYLNVGNNTATTYVVAQTNGDVNVTATRDQDYVVVYGIRGNQVQFTIRCVDASTGALLRTLTYWGDVGDRPMIILPYIEGYTPPLTQGTTPSALSANSSQNVWNARYTRITTTTTTTTTTIVTGGGGGGAGGAVAGGAAANNQNANNQNANNQQQGVDNAANNPTPNIPADFGGYEDIVDLDVPLAAPDFGTSGSPAVPNAPTVIEPNSHSRLPSWALVLSAVVLLGLIAMLYWYLLFYRKKKKYANANDEIDFGDYDDEDDF